MRVAHWFRARLEVLIRMLDRVLKSPLWMVFLATPVVAALLGRWDIVVSCLIVAALIFIWVAQIRRRPTNSR